MRRRDFITFLGGATAGSLGSTSIAWPSIACAQKRIPVVGILLFGGAGDPRDIGIVRELIRIGYVEGRNVGFTVHAADGAIDLLSQLAHKLVAANPDVIVGSGSSVAHALGEIATNIPVVMTVVGDPIALGLSNSMSNPSRNFTGFTNSSVALSAKRLEVLRELFPGAHKVAYLWAPESPMTQARGEQVRLAAKALGIELVPLPLMSSTDLSDAFALAQKEKIAAVLVESDLLMIRISNNIIDECLVRDLPAMHVWPFEVRAGALISYGPAAADNHPGAANYVDRLLRGAKVAELPFQEPTQLKLAINLRTARSIGITVPPSLLARADEVIE